MVNDTLSNCDSCLIRPSEAKPHPYLTAGWRQQLVKLYSFWLTGQWCTKVRAVFVGRSTAWALILLGLALYLPSASLSSVLLVLYIYILIFLHPFLYLLVSWAWWDWPFTWLTNHCHSVLWHCWLGHVSRKIVPEMTCVEWDVKPYYRLTDY